MKIILEKYLILIVLIFVNTVSFAGPIPPPPKVPPPGTPIDSSIYILLAMALVYGLYKIFLIKKHKKTPN